MTQFHEAFHIMLEGTALQHYRNTVRQNREIIPPADTLVTLIEELFGGKRHKKCIEIRGTKKTLFSILAEQSESGKDVDWALTTLLQRLGHLQQHLSYPHCTGEILNGKFWDNFKGLPAANLAYSITLREDTSIDSINRPKSNISA